MIYALTLNAALDRELLVPAFASDKVLRANTVRVDWGGKVFNVSRALAALRAETMALGFVCDATGETRQSGWQTSVFARILCRSRARHEPTFHLQA